MWQHQGAVNAPLRLAGSTPARPTMYIIVVTSRNSGVSTLVTGQSLDEIDAEWTPKFQWDEGYDMSYEEGDSIDVFEISVLFPQEPTQLKMVGYMSWSNDKGYYFHIV